MFSNISYVIYYKFAKFELKNSPIHRETKKTNFAKGYELNHMV
jgi:hypothetical protein